jgi:hypothetical protein
MDIWTWNPIQSKQVREICQHLTRDEKWRLVSLSGFFGLCMGLIMQPFIWSIVTWTKDGQANSFALVMSSSGIVLVVAGIVVMRQKVRRMLCDTAWAREQGITPQNLKLDIFDERKN